MVNAVGSGVNPVNVILVKEQKHVRIVKGEPYVLPGINQKRESGKCSELCHGILQSC